MLGNIFPLLPKEYCNSCIFFGADAPPYSIQELAGLGIPQVAVDKRTLMEAFVSYIVQGEVGNKRPEATVLNIRWQVADRYIRLEGLELLRFLAEVHKFGILLAVDRSSFLEVLLNICSSNYVTNLYLI